ELPTSPRIPLSGVEEFCLGPGLSTIRAHRDLRDLGLARPRRAENRVGLVRGERFIHTWPGDLGLHLHLAQRAAHGFALYIIPVSIVGRLPVSLKRLAHGVDMR